MSNANNFVLRKYNALEKRITLDKKEVEKNPKNCKTDYSQENCIVSFNLFKTSKLTEKMLMGKRKKQVVLLNKYLVVNNANNFFSGSPVLCHGVCQWWRSHVQNSAGREIQRTSGCVRERESHLISHLIFDI